MEELEAWLENSARHAMHDLNRAAHSAGLSLAQVNVLLHLRYGGPRGVMDFTGIMQLSPAGASQMIDRLVVDGLVERVEWPGDRRVRRVQLTVAGSGVVATVLAARGARLRALLDKLSEDQQRQVAETLALLNGSVSDDPS